MNIVKIVGAILICSGLMNPGIAFSKNAKFKLLDINTEPGAAAFIGPGTAIIKLRNCKIKFNLVKGEMITFNPKGIGIGIHIEPGGFYSLSCYSGKKMEGIRESYTTPDGKLGMDEDDIARAKEYPDLNIHAEFFNGKNWKGVGVTEDYLATDKPIQNMRFCLIGDKQALCGGTTVIELFNLKDRGFEELTEQLNRIEFIDDEIGKPEPTPPEPEAPPKRKCH
ncbi:hypothetical protein RGU70_11135 [Herbaspirillum sp. RTI4]|uniref:hypothetical protein n=1 Tax=Herbaspirillum sp. RTI4 TaxID=3048640 RepID=UPI002AB4AE61|nr:hypothetical protein [Herbaspirillum sp. RTI4]MDY7578873.1 hypothetical protein [Herbaspirillum sp. RTI4]